MNLEFQNAVFNDGLNVTVRQGDKWHGTTGSVPVIDIAGRTFDEKYRGEAYVLGSLLLFFDDIPAGLLRHEHDPSCRTKKGLKAELKRVYGYGNSFQEDANFATKKWTVLLFSPSNDEFRLEAEQ
ncbi:MAG TPA: hypothetical protein ENH62_05155 [Marinobacter sp.]|uniref:Uncharacterized protein n=1 Tax=marine sediment metagenome TaxID=412755 RepID=A0A0F9RHS6_9ZZZZ|nr:hypothetical protein [Marinobacter sp.]